MLYIKPAIIWVIWVILSFSSEPNAKSSRLTRKWARRDCASIEYCDTLLLEFTVPSLCSSADPSLTARFLRSQVVCSRQAPAIAEIDSTSFAVISWTSRKSFLSFGIASLQKSCRMQNSINCPDGSNPDESFNKLNNETHASLRLSLFTFLMYT